MIDPVISRAIAIGFALLLLCAAWHKVSARDRFSAALADYRLLPGALLRPAVLALPLLEVALGLAWLAGFESGAVAFLTAALMGVYAAAIAINLWRGRVHIGCGCGLGGSSAEDQPLSWWLVARNLLLGAVAALAALPPADRVFGLLDGLTLAFALVTSCVLYLGASQLMRNGAAIASWRTPRD